MAHVAVLPFLVKQDDFPVFPLFAVLGGHVPAAVRVLAAAFPARIAVALEPGSFRSGGTFLFLTGFHHGRQPFLRSLPVALLLRLHLPHHAGGHHHLAAHLRRPRGGQPFLRHQISARQQKQMGQNGQQKTRAPGNPEQPALPPLIETHGGNHSTVR